MAINIVDMLKSQIGGQIAGQIGKKFGESEQSAKTGIEAMIPTVLGGLLKQATAPGGAQKLDKALTDGGYDGSLLDNISGMLTGGGASGAGGKGGDVMSMLFGDKVAMIAPILAKLTGMKPSSITSILGVVAPLIMSFLGKQKQSMGLDANGMASFLTSQKDNIGAAMPLGMVDAMGLGSLGFAKPSAGRAVTPAPSAASGNGMSKVLAVLAILAAVGFGAYKYIFAGIRPQGAAGNVLVEIDPNAVPMADPRSSMAPVEAAPTPETTAAPVADSVEPAAGKLTGVMDGLTLPGMDQMPGFKSMFSSMTESLEKIKDTESAKAAMADLASMDEKLGTMTSGLSALPEAMRGKVTESMKSMMPEFQATIDKVMAIPGVKEILQPIIDSMMGKLKSITG